MMWFFNRLNLVISKLYLLVSFLVRYAWFLFRSNMVVLRAIIEPEGRVRPGLLAYRLRASGSWEIFWLAHLITLSPGTLSVRYAPEAGVLYIHALYVEGVDDFRDEITEGLERPIMELLR